MFVGSGVAQKWHIRRILFSTSRWITVIFAIERIEFVDVRLVACPIGRSCDADLPAQLATWIGCRVDIEIETATYNWRGLVMTTVPKKL